MPEYRSRMTTLSVLRINYSAVWSTPHCKHPNTMFLMSQSLEYERVCVICHTRLTGVLASRMPPLMWWADLQWVHFAPGFYACLEGLQQVKSGYVNKYVQCSHFREEGTRTREWEQPTARSSQPLSGTAAWCPRHRELYTPAHWDSARAIAVQREGLGHVTNTDDV